LEHLRLTR